MSLKDVMQEYRRLAILRFLYVSPDYTVNNQILKETLNNMGYICTENTLNADIYFLANANCLDYEQLDDNLYLIKLANLGGDVARGRAFIEGIKRPAPGDNLPPLPF